MLFLLENDVRLQILLCLSLLTFVVIPLSLLLSIPLILAAIVFRIPSHMIFIIGILCTVLLCCFGVTAVEILHMNHRVLLEFFHSSLHVSLNDSLISFPFSCLMSAVIVRLHEKKNPLHVRMRNLSRGKLPTEHAVLSEKTINKLLAAIKTSAVENGSCIGVDVHTGERIVLTDQQMNLHTLAVGTTGSGKTTGIFNIVESVVTRGLPLIFIDGKGDLALAKKVESLCNNHGRKFYLFSMLGESVKYNPLASGGATSKKDRIIALREWSEDHYKKIAEGYLQTVFSILEKANVSVDLGLLSHYLDAANLTRLAQREGLLDQFKSQLQQLHKYDEDISSLRAEVDNLANSEIGELFDCQNGEVLTLEKALDENAAVYFCLQPLAFPSYAELLGKLVINDCKVLASKQLGKSNQKKIYAIFDEFSVFAGEQVVNLINQGRSAGIHAILSTQSISDIAKQGGDALVGQVVNNCNNFLIQRQNNPDDAEMLASIVGTKNIFEVTSQLSTVDRASPGNVKSVKEYWVHPDEIKRLKQGKGVVVDKQTFKVSRTSYRRV